VVWKLKSYIWGYANKKSLIPLVYIVKFWLKSDWSYGHFTRRPMAFHGQSQAYLVKYLVKGKIFLMKAAKRKTLRIYSQCAFPKRNGFQGNWTKMNEPTRIVLLCIHFLPQAQWPWLAAETFSVLTFNTERSSVKQIKLWKSLPISYWVKKFQLR
jgi:hypothetical protein